MPRGRLRGDAVLGDEFRQYFMGFASVETDDAEAVYSRNLICLKQDLRAVRRPTRVIPIGCNLPLRSCSAQRRYDEQSTLTVLRSIRYIFAIRRPVRLPIMIWTLGYLNGIAAAD